MNIPIESAVEHFRSLLVDQIKRAEKITIEKQNESKQIKPITIGVIDGDGIGPIIMRETYKILNVLLKREIDDGTIVFKIIKGLTIENRIKCNQSVPESILKEIKKCDVILKGPTATPKGGKMESANVTLRRELDLYANIRPVTIPAEGIDWTFFRENTEGEYVLGSKGIEIENILCMDFKVTTYSGTQRIAKAAYEYAVKNGKNHVSIVTKANIMKKTDGIFSEICNNIAKNYPDIKTEDWYIDIMTANLVNPEIRNKFQVFILPNLYGDIITDEAAQIQGGVGTAGSANIGDRYAMFEAIHGTAPRLIEEGKGEYANPSSLLRAACMMLNHIGKQEYAKVLTDALDGITFTEPMTTREFADIILSEIL